MITLSNILQHYAKAEEGFVRLVYNGLEEVKYNYLEKHFYFLDPNELGIVEQLAKSFGVNLVIDGGYEDSELKYVIAYNEEMGYVPEAKLLVYELKYNRKFNNLLHKQVMGTLYNSGIDVSLIGDIVVSDDSRVQFVLSQDLEEILRLTVLKYANIKVEYVKEDTVSIVPKDMKRKVYSAKSLRLDAISKMLSKISRTKMSKNIIKGDVRVNHKVIVDPKFEIKEGDLVSIRGSGRFLIYQIVPVNNKYNILYDEQK